MHKVPNIALHYTTILVQVDRGFTTWWPNITAAISAHAGASHGVTGRGEGVGRKNQHSWKDGDRYAIC